MEPERPIVEQVAELYRSESRRVLATLIRLLGDFDLAEEALQEAFRAALEQWPREECGLTTEEIARAFLVTPSTTTRRIARAKERIRKERIPYEIPSRAKLAKRLQAVLQVVYLVYNEGLPVERFRSRTAPSWREKS